MTKKLVFGYQSLTRKPRDLETVVSIGKFFITLLMYTPIKYLTTFKLPQRKPIKIHQLTFPSPVTAAAYEAHLPLLELFLRVGCGGVCVKTMMISARSGNNRPRLQEITINEKPALINALGLPGKGIHAMAKKIKKSALLSFKRPIGLSIGGHHRTDYQEGICAYEKEFKHYKHIYYELNISCPNTEDGQDLTKNIDLLADLIQFCRSQTDKVISVKLTPDLEDKDIVSIATMVGTFKHMMINVGNTTKRACTDVGLQPTAISIGAGGLSGPSLCERTLQMVTLIKPIGVPIMSTGGIHDISSVKAALNAGADVVGMATALVFNPFDIYHINQSL